MPGISGLGNAMSIDHSDDGYDIGTKAASARHFILGGQIMLHQDHKGGHRAGLDGVMLAASVKPGKPGKPLRVYDLGAGVGTAGLCVAWRISDADVTLVENDPAILSLCRMTLADPDNAAFSERVASLDADVTLRGEKRSAAGLTPDSADRVIMNPPYWSQGSVRVSPDPGRANAHVLNSEGLAPWFRTATSVLCSGGILSVIFPADSLDLILVEMRGRFGAITVFPLFRGAGEPATRVIVTGIKGSKAPMRILPGLALHKPLMPGQSRRAYTPEADAILHGRAGLVI
ncbi:MAG: methyltransferase [Pseudomonadota bacterium]